MDEALADFDWVLTMQEELNQFERQEVWALVPRPKNKSVILELDGSTVINLMVMALLYETKPYWLLKVTPGMREFIMMKPMLQLHVLRPSEFFLHLLHTPTSKFIKWM